MAETRLQIIQVDQDLRSEVATELRDVQGKISEFVERKVSAEDQLMRAGWRGSPTRRPYDRRRHIAGRGDHARGAGGLTI